MAATRAAFLCFALLPLFFLSASAQTCDYTFTNGRSFEKCTSLVRLGAFLHWTHRPTEGTVDVGFRAPLAGDGFVAWALNPTGSGMRGAQALVALRNTSGAMWAYTTPIADTSPNMRPATLSFPVASTSAELRDGFMFIFATVTLPSNRTSINHVWQVSNMVSNGLPAGHGGGDSLLSFGSFDFLSGTSSTGGNSRFRRQNVHGVLNAVSWGVLMPIGVIIARYMRVFKSADPAWFYLHVGCQVTAYGLGVAGWGTGLKLGSDSVGITRTAHRNLGITLFCLATLQMFALLLRPNKDHKYRIYWNVYHHSVGYSIIIMSVINIFKGFEALDREKKWKNAYIAVISTLGGIALLLEAVTWIIVLKRRAKGGDKSHHGVNGAANGYGA